MLIGSTETCNNIIISVPPKGHKMSLQFMKKTKITEDIERVLPTDRLTCDARKRHCYQNSDLWSCYKYVHSRLVYISTLHRPGRISTICRIPCQLLPNFNHMIAPWYLNMVERTGTVSKAAGTSTHLAVSAGVLTCPQMLMIILFIHSNK